MVKMQKTRPSEGYHNWHCESGSSLYDRTTILAWMVYLNDVEDGGGTEFKYQGLRHNAKKGKTLIWPSDFTHTHRGVISQTKEKYIVTGWYTYTT